MADLRRKTENLFNLNAVDTAKGYMENYRLNSGNPDTAVGNFISEYIDVTPFTTYTISGFTAGWSSSVAWYDSTFAKIGYQLYENKSINTFTVPSNAKYVRFTGDMSKKNITMFNLGSTALTYEPYWPHSLKKFDGTTWQDAAVKEYDGSVWQ